MSIEVNSDEEHRRGERARAQAKTRRRAIALGQAMTVIGLELGLEKDQLLTALSTQWDYTKRLRNEVRGEAEAGAK